MAKLVACYSRAGENYFGGRLRRSETGNTEKAARKMAALIGADLFQIEPAEPYAADYQTCIEQAKRDLQQHARPRLKELPESLDDYDEIYLGYPNYWGDMPMPVYTFLEAFDWNGKTIHPFCTHEGSGLAGTERKIRRTCRGASVTEGLAIRGSDVDKADEKIKEWLKK